MSDTIKQQSWDNLGYDQYLSSALGYDPNYITSSDFNSNIQDGSITTVKVADISAGKIRTGVLESTDGKTYFDLDNKRLIVNDGTNDRVLLGYQSGGF